MVKATFWTDPELLRWPAPKRWWYVSLWAMAEDSACIEDSPFGWKITAWPTERAITEARMAQWRDDLVGEGKLVPYQAGGKAYLYLPKMAQHELPRNPQSPQFPLPPWVQWVPNTKDARKGRYVHGPTCGDVVEGLYDASSTVPDLSCPDLTCPVRPCPGRAGAGGDDSGERALTERAAIRETLAGARRAKKGGVPSG